MIAVHHAQLAPDGVLDAGGSLVSESLLGTSSSLYSLIDTMLEDCDKEALVEEASAEERGDQKIEGQELHRQSQACTVTHRHLLLSPSCWSARSKSTLAVLPSRTDSFCSEFLERQARKARFAIGDLWENGKASLLQSHRHRNRALRA